MMRFLAVLGLLVLALTMPACGTRLAEAGTDPESGPDGEPPADGGTELRVDGGGSDAPSITEDGGQSEGGRASVDLVAPISGQAVLFEQQDGVSVDLAVSNMPVGMHGVRILEATACDGSLTHWNPTNVAHGYPTASVHHAGDLGNVVVEANGTGSLKVVLAGVNLRSGDEMSALGHAFTIAQGTDDGTGLTGNAGPSITCAIIRLD